MEYVVNVEEEKVNVSANSFSLYKQTKLLNWNDLNHST